MATFLNDQFAGVDGDTLTTYNPAWRVSSGYVGSITLTGGKARHNSGTTLAGYYRNDAAPQSADYSASCDITVTASIGSATMAVAGRMVGTANTMYYARLSSTAVTLIKLVGGSATTLGSSPVTPVVGSTYNLRLEMLGSTVNAYLDGVLMATATDTSIAGAGFIGLRSVSGNANLSVDNLLGYTAEAGSQTTTVSPLSAALSVAGFAPTVGRTANQAVSPAQAAISVHGYAPVIARSANQSVAPGLALLTVRGYAPSVTQSAGGSVSPAAAALAVRGFAPTIGQTTTRMLTPVPAALQVRGFAPTISQPGQSTGTPPDSSSSGGGGAYGGSGSVREVRAFADLLDRAERPTKNERKRRKRAIEAAVLELLPDEPAAEKAAPVIARMVERELPAAVWAPVRAMQPVAQPRALPAAVVEDVRAKVAEWLAEQERIALLEDDFETELLLLG